MTFYDKKHKKLIENFEKLWNSQVLYKLSNMASKYNINDIFQDNGAKVLQQLIYLNLKNLPGREGNDAISPSGTEWEMKSINLETSASGFSTNHHTNHEILEKYRKVSWAFSIYNGIKLESIYVMSAKMLEPLFEKWTNKLNEEKRDSLNNPKIPLKFVKENGLKVYPINPLNPIDPDSINQS